MADMQGANAYFAATTRRAEWESQNADAREAAIHEADSMIACLPFARRPPTANRDKAIYEQAYCLLFSQDQAGQRVSKAIAAGIKSRSVADASESYATTADLEKDPSWINGLYYCPRALMWLRGYLGAVEAIRTGRVVMRDGY